MRMTRLRRSSMNIDLHLASSSEGDNEPEPQVEAEGDGMDVEEEDAEGEEDQDEDDAAGEDVDVEDEDDAEGEADEIDPEADEDEDEEDEEEEEEEVRPTRSRAAASRSKRKPPPKTTKAKPSPKAQQQQHLKIKLKLPALPSTADTSAAATPTPSETSPTKSASRRRGVDVESEDEDEDDYDGDNDYSRSTSVTGTAPPTRPMTTRQAVLASVVDSSHVALTDEGSSKKKKVLNESELALRREETARKRKNLSEKKLEDEKAETINRLLKKQSRPKNKRQTAISSTEDRTPNPPGTKARPSDDEEMQGEADEVVEDLYVPPPDPIMYRWISTTRTPGSIGDERPGDSEAMQGVEGASTSSSSAEKKMFITFSVPNCVLYPNGREEEGARHVAMGADGATSASKTATVGAVPRLKVVSPAVQKEKSRCAIPDCGKERKYRLVKDWQIGACGMEHLKVLEAK